MEDEFKPAEQIKKPFELPKTGWHPAVCSQVVALGYQKFGEEVSSYPQAAILFELEEKMKEGDNASKPFVMTWKGSNVLSKPESKKKSNLSVLLSGWNGSDMTEKERSAFSLRDLLKRGAFINVKHETGKDSVTRAVIASVGPIPPGVIVPKPVGTEVPKWLADIRAKAVAPKAPGGNPTAPARAEEEQPLQF